MKALVRRFALTVVRLLPWRGPRTDALIRRLYLGDLLRRDVMKWRLERARLAGVKMGEGCKLYRAEFISEPYLVELGRHVVVADAVRFITHDGGVWVFWDERPEIDHYGKIVVGDNVFIGMNSIILPGTVIGNNCVIGAGSVVRGVIPDDSVILGNPAKVVMQTSMYRAMLLGHRMTLPTALIPLTQEGLDRRRAMVMGALAESDAAGTRAG